jgi:colanic acid/amylovoran biosynthesis glycosyltransferase
VEQRTGLLTPERDYEAMADALCHLLGDEELWRSFRSAALQDIERRFDLKKQTAALEEIYNEVLAQ